MVTKPAALNSVRVVRLPVQVDVTNAADVRGALDEELQGRVTVLVVDLAATESLSLEGLQVLVLARTAANRRGADFRLAAAKPQVRRFLDVTGTRQLFPLYESVAAARIAHDGHVDGTVSASGS